MSIRIFCRHWRMIVMAVCLVSAWPGHSQILGPEFKGAYTVRDLGVPSDVLGFRGSILFKAGDSATLLVAGYLPDGNDTELFEMKVSRDASGHISGFSGAPSWLLHASGNPAAVDISGLYSGCDFGPSGVLFYPTWDASIAQVKSGAQAPGRFVFTQELGIDGRVSGLGFVPDGFPGSGRLKMTSTGWLDTVVTADGAGTFSIAAPGHSVDLSSADGFVYAKAGQPGITKPSVLVASSGNSVVNVYEIDANGDPLVATERLFLSDFASVQGAIADPATGDFLFASADVNQPHIYVVGHAAVGTPVVTITSPADGSRFRAPVTIQLSADAKEEGGTISKVEFYQGTTLLAAITAPSSFDTQVDSLTAGEFDFKAIAYDAGGLSATSKLVHVSVVNEGPILTLLSPTDNLTLRPCSDLWFNVQAQAGNSDIAAIEFRDGAALLGTLTPSGRSETLAFVTRHVSEGAHTYSVKATDRNGLSTMAVVTNVFVQTLPLQTLAIHHYNPGQLMFCFKGTPGGNYVWQSAASLPNPVWVPFLTNVAPAVTLRMTNQFNESAQPQFYRTQRID